MFPDVLSSVDQVHGAKPLIHMNCCVFKIHGDYMDTRIRNTPSELGEYPEEYDNFLVLQRRVILQGNSWADFEAGNERVRVSRDERSVAEEEDLSVFSHNASL